MTDLARLQIRVQSLEAQIAGDRLDGLTESGKRADRATDGLMSTMKRFVGVAALAAGAVSSLRKTVDITREFEVLNAQLITATGASESAALAFEAIQDFASTTPYDLQQVTDGFTKLVNLGLTPSERALTSYGDTASAMGKDLNQLIEAVADAATGEFERLKEFGIRASSQGDQVSFTFRGVTTTVQKNAAEIEKYLIGLGENNFAGAMAQRMATLDGAISNLTDEWNKAWLNISNLGVGAIIEDSIRTAISALEEFNAMVASGQLEATFEAFVGRFDQLGGLFADSLTIMSELWADFLSSDTGGGLAYSADQSIDFIIDAFRHLPENISAIIKLIGVEIATLVTYGREYGLAFGEVLGIQLAKTVDIAGSYGKEIADKLNPFDGDTFDLDAALAQADTIAADLSDAVFSRVEEEARKTAESRKALIMATLDERQEVINTYATEIKAIDDLRKKYDEATAARRATSGDRLAQFGQGAEGDSGPSPAQQKEFEKLEKALRTEEEAIQESYDRRLAIILANTVEGSEKQLELKKRLDEQFATDALGDFATPDTFEEQLDKLQEEYERRRELILNNTKITEEQRTELEEELTRNRNERLEMLEKQRLSTIFNASSELFGGLASLAKGFAGEQSTLYKGLFAVSKAFAIADAVVKIQQGIANAASLPFPANLGAMTSVVSATAGIVGTIQGTDFSGAYDQGGYIPGGKIGIAGEFGPEIIEGPARVTSRQQTMDLFREAKESGVPNVNVDGPTILNVLDPSVVMSVLNSAGGKKVILNTLKENPELIRSLGSAA